MPSELKALMLRPPRLSLAVAESMTSGRLQARIGEISGASNFFLGGITAYTLDQKVRLLRVNRRAAQQVDCVSAGVAEAMARGACRLFKADVGVATTGYAERSKSPRVNQPYAYWAIAWRRGKGGFEIRCGRKNCPGMTRIAAQKAVAAAAYAALVEWLREPAAGGSSSAARPRRAE